MYHKPGAEMRMPAPTAVADWQKEIKSRDTTYFLWIAIPIKLGFVGMLAYVIISQNDISSTFIMWFLGLAFAWWLTVTPMIYGLKRSLQAFAVLAAIIALVITLMEWLVF